MMPNEEEFQILSISISNHR